MHNEYTTQCILDKRKKLKLLNYEKIDITKVATELQEITLNLINDFYNHVEKVHENSKKKSKKYYKIEPFVTEQLKDMLFNKKNFIEYFSKPGPKTKEDLFIYIFANQITDNYYNEYLYQVIIKYLKQEYFNDLWEKNELNKFEVNTWGLLDLYIMRDTPKELNVGKADINIDKSVKVIENYLKKYDSNREQLTKLRNIVNVLDNYYDKTFMIPIGFAPYQDVTNELIDNIIVSLDMEKAKQKIKRL